MSEITQPPPDVPTQDSNTRVNRLSAASDQSTSNKQSAEQNQGQKAAEVEQEKPATHHDPAVTLASTLAKLDSGSHFQASVSGQDADGRTIIASELGTYLVETENAKLTKVQAEELSKLAKDDNLDVRVLTVDKEIKAEVIKQNEGNIPSQAITIPVTLTLTELGQQQATPQPTTQPAHAPIDDIRSQYQATTLYRAERLAREIGDKLDNLPLPTTSPNYTVYGSATETNDKAQPQAPQQVSHNVFIQEVRTSTVTPNTNIGPTAENLNQILGQNIQVSVLKTVPQSPVPLLQGLPESVVKEINISSPLDTVNKGQNLLINVTALAIPEEKGSVPIPPPTSQTNVGRTNPAITPTAATNSNPSTTANAVKTTEAVATQTLERNQPAINSTLISGIVIDPIQSRDITGTNTQPPAPSFSSAPSPYSNKALGQASNVQSNNDKPYYLATPTTVLKFNSPVPLVAGTVINFSVQPESNNPNDSTATQKQNTQTITSASTATTTGAVPQSNSEISSSQNTVSTPAAISPAVADRIDQFFPQSLEQLPEDWSSISLALSALTSTASNAAAAAMTSRIPNMLSPEQITSTMFFFLSAIKSTTPAKTWVGPDVLTKLRQIGAGRILERIDHDFTRIARLGAEAPANDWRPTIIPFQSGGDITGVPMIVKQISDEDKEQQDQNSNPNDEKNIKATRFILELNFSQFGHVLIDGLLKENRLDLIVKATDTIPYAVKAKLSRRFTDALEQSSFAGELVIIDEAPTDISIAKIVENMTHKINFEKQI